MTSLSISKLRTELSDTVNRVAFGGERIILDRHGKHVAALVSIRDLDALKNLEPADGAASWPTTESVPSASVSELAATDL